MFNILIELYSCSVNHFAILNTLFMHCALMFSIMKLFCDFQFPIYELNFNVVPHEIILQFLRPNICTELWCFPSWYYYAIFKVLYLHWALMFLLKNLFNYFYRMYAMNFDVFPHEIILQYLMSNICTVLKCLPSRNFFAIFNAQYLHCTLIFSLLKLFCNF